MNSEEDKKRAMLEINVAQAAYYNETDGGLTSKRNGFATNLWRKMRQRALVTVSDAQRAKVYEAHKTWLGDLSEKKVLELGSGHGCPLTHYLATNAREYHALDLSQKEIDLLKAGLPKGVEMVAHVVDFLSDEFKERDFDVIYAHSVLHHFKHVDVILDRIGEKLSSNGTVISYDPLQVWLPIRLLRAAYRPFQTDADWEYPFTRAVCNQIATKFEIIDQFGVFNRAKWAMILGILNPKWGQAYGDRWFARDLNERVKQSGLMKSLHISFFFKKR